MSIYINGRLQGIDALDIDTNTLIVRENADLGFIEGSVIFEGETGLTEKNDGLFYDPSNGGTFAVGSNAGMRNAFQVVKEEGITNPDTIKALLVARNTETQNGNWAGFSWQTEDITGDIYSGARILTEFTSHAENAVSGDLVFDTRNIGTRTEKMRLTSEGNLGIGTDSPTAVLNLKSGTTSNPPLKFNSGVNLDTREAGTIEYDGTRFYITNNSARRVISRASDSITTPVTVANTIDETIVFTATLPAETLKVGKVYIILAYGKGSTHDANDTLTIRCKINGTTLLTLTSTPKLVTDVPMHLHLTNTVRTLGEIGTFASHGDVLIEDTKSNINVSSTIVNTTIANDLTITFQWDSADEGNSATLDQAFLQSNN